MKSVYEKKEDCYGCSACANVCPKMAITMCQDEQGFLYPVIDDKMCVDCGLCQKVCQIGNEKKFIYPAVSECLGVKNQDFIRQKSSSGGIYTAISDLILLNSEKIFGGGHKNGVCAGVIFDNDYKVKHVLAHTQMERDLFRGSKYVQSSIENTYKQIVSELRNNVPVLFTGTPCQVAGLRAYLQGTKTSEELLVTNDVVCHGVPSPGVWKDYVDFLQKKYNSKLTEFTFRNKKVGWRGYNISAGFENGKIVGNEKSTKIFTNLFLKDIMLRPSCFYCPYAQMGRCSDITIGDFWGIEKAIPDFSDNQGISMVLLNTQRGEKVFDKVCTTLEIEKCSVNKLTQHNLYTSTQHGEDYDRFWIDYHNGGFIKVAKKYGGYGALSKLRYYKAAIKFKVRRLFK